VLESLAGESEEARKVLQAKEAEFGRDIFLSVARNVLLQTLDMLWVDHLESMEYLRGSVNLRAYGQRDPLTEYRKEGLLAYKELEITFATQVFEMLDKLHKDTTRDAVPTRAVVPIPTINLAAAPEQSSGERKEPSRNDPCPCGSGKKYKKCCGK